MIIEMPVELFPNIVTNMKKINVNEDIINTLSKLAFAPPYDNTLYNFLSFVFQRKIKSIEKHNVAIDEKRNIDLLYIYSINEHFIFSFRLFPHDIANIIENKTDIDIDRDKIIEFTKKLIKEEFP